MKSVGHAYQTLYSELAQRSLDARFVTDFPAEGRFVPVTVKGRKYWYFDQPPEPGSPGKKRTYVGPADDAEIAGRVEAFKDLKADVRERRKIVSTLVREARLPRPDRMAGDIVQALADAGFFRLRGVLVGTVAFQAYSALLGVRLDGGAMQTADADFAQFHSISAAVGDHLPPMLDVLRSVDETFRGLPKVNDRGAAARFASRSGYRVEFLTPNTGSDDFAGRPAPMPALDGASAQPLRFLGFLIHRPERAVLLHGAGVPVLVPAPARYAIHKLIVASRRQTDGDGLAKSAKDIRQAGALAEALIETRRGDDLAETHIEAWDRGPAWRDAIRASLRALAPEASVRLGEALAAGVRGLGGDPAKYGLAP